MDINTLADAVQDRLKISLELAVRELKWKISDLFHPIDVNSEDCHLSIPIHEGMYCIHCRVLWRPRLKQFNYFNLDGQPGDFTSFMAESILDADKMFEAKFGKHPAKIPHIVLRWYTSGLL